MAFERSILRAALVSFAVGGPACATTPGTDGETHFACSAQSDCAARGIAGPCVDGTCVEGSGGSAGSPAGGKSGNSMDATTLVDAASSRCESQTVSTPFPGTAFNGARVDLSTFCSIGGGIPPCPADPAEVLRNYVCGPESAPPPLAPGPGVLAHRAIGCGLEFVYVYAVASDWIHVFSLSTGELIGAAYWTDEPSGSCNAGGFVAGAIPDCPEARRYLCVPASKLAADAGAYADCRRACDASCPPCATCSSAEQEALRALPERPECDCSIPPGVDPCFAPASCGCWCEQITSLKEACPGVR